MEILLKGLLVVGAMFVTFASNVILIVAALWVAKHLGIL